MVHGSGKVIIDFVLNWVVPVIMIILYRNSLIVVVISSIFAILLSLLFRNFSLLVSCRLNMFALLSEIFSLVKDVFFHLSMTV